MRKLIASIFFAAALTIVTTGCHHHQPVASDSSAHASGTTSSFSVHRGLTTERGTGTNRAAYMVEPERL